MLIRQAEVYPHHAIADLRVANKHIIDIAPRLEPLANENTVFANGAALVPSLTDHHIHLMSLAAAMQSIDCQGMSPTAFNAALTQHANRNRKEWLRVINYHEDTAGSLNCAKLDRLSPDRPVRVQHCSGRLWVLNSAGLHKLGLNNKRKIDALETYKGRATGRIVDADLWLRHQLAQQRPDLTYASRLLASHGISHVTDTTPSNTRNDWDFFTGSHASGELLQTVRMMGSTNNRAQSDKGEIKIHLIESKLPSPKCLQTQIESAHECGRNVAIHCVTLIELLLALDAWKNAGVNRGDRIEHAAITPAAQLDAIAQLGIRVITQPHFIWQRGDRYLKHVDIRDQADLYRLRSFIDAGIALAAGSDAAHGDTNPWQAMQSAVDRTSLAGVVMGAGESLTAEQALSLYSSEPQAPGCTQRQLIIGAPANLCLLDRPWQAARKNLAAVRVNLTLREGMVIHNMRAC